MAVPWSTLFGAIPWSDVIARAPDLDPDDRVGAQIIQLRAFLAGPDVPPPPVPLSANGPPGPPAALASLSADSGSDPSGSKFLRSARLVCKPLSAAEATRADADAHAGDG